MKAAELWTESFNLTLAGPGSTAAALTSVLFCLGLPNGRLWQEKIRLEASETATDSALSSLSIPPLLLAVLKETLRLHVSFPTAFPRTITPGAENAIPNLPAPLPVGTAVSANTYVLGRSRDIWGDDADAWRPERWLGKKEGNSALAKDADSESVSGSQIGKLRHEVEEERTLEDSFVAFGKGSRGCVGRELALLICARAVLAVLNKWEISSTATGLKGNAWLEMQYSECWLGFKKIENTK
jgi:cytochrome P450